MSVAAKLEASASADLSSPFYFNASHWRAMDGIAEGATNREGIMVMTGPTGSGKTMLMRAISDNLPEGATPLFLQYASLNFREFVNFLHNSLDVADEIQDAPNKAVALRKFLYAQAERKESAVIFVDEAQNLEPDVLKMLPKLACFDKLEDGTNVGLQFMLTGGSELREILEDPDLKNVRDAVARSYELRFFTREELKHFLGKRLAPLERMTPEPITQEGIESVARYTGGSPRLIGMICSHAMLFAAENPGRSIDAKMIDEAAEALMITPAENSFAHEEKETVEFSGPFSTQEAADDETPKSIMDEVDLLEGEDDDDFEGIDMTISDAPSEDYDDDTVSEMAMDADLPHADDMYEEMDDFGLHVDIDEIKDEIDESVLEKGPRRFGLTKICDAIGSGAAKAVGAVSAAGLFAGRLKRKTDGADKPSALVKERTLPGRDGRIAERNIAPTEKRQPKTLIVGQREKRMKATAIAAGIAVLFGGVYLKRASISDAVANVGESASTAAGSLGGMASTIATDIGTSSSRLLADTIPQTSDSDTPTGPSGWGAKVELARDAQLPDAGVELARGALNMVDRALDLGTEILPESLQGALAVASEDVAGARRSITVNGASPEEAAERGKKYVADGDDYFQQQLYIAPAGGNAYDSYRAALDLDPNNADALRGIEKLRVFYSNKADEARKSQQWDRANRHFETALSINKLKSIR